MTDPDRWPRVKEIFHSALAVSADDRAALVREIVAKTRRFSKRLSRSLWRMARPEIRRKSRDRRAGQRGTHAELGGRAALAPGVEIGVYRIVESLDSGRWAKSIGHATPG